MLIVSRIYPTDDKKQTIPERGVVRLYHLFYILGAAYISGTSEARVVKFCIRLNISGDNKLLPNGRGQGHVIH